MEIRRLTAKKASIEEICAGKFVNKPGFESSYVLTTLGRKLSRVRVMALIVDKFIAEDDKYGTLTLDDGTETIRCKIFTNVKSLEPYNKGDFADIFGKVKAYNGETYIMPEIIRKVNSNSETLRMLELQKIYKDQKFMIQKIKDAQKTTSDINELKSIVKDVPVEELEAIIEAEALTENTAEEAAAKTAGVKEKVLALIEKDGTGYEELIKKSGLEESVIDSTIQDLLETGICFEPRPGIIKKL